MVTTPPVHNESQVTDCSSRYLTRAKALCQREALQLLDVHSQNWPSTPPFPFITGLQSWWTLKVDVRSCQEQLQCGCSSPAALQCRWVIWVYSLTTLLDSSRVNNLYKSLLSEYTLSTFKLSFALNYVSETVNHTCQEVNIEKSSILTRR